MASTTYKVLGQAAPAATTETDLYTVPASTSAIGSTFMVANRAATSATFRLSVSVGGGVTANKDYLIYDSTIGGNAVASFTLGITLATTDKIKVYASSANISFNLFGTQVA